MNELLVSHDKSREELSLGDVSYFRLMRFAIPISVNYIIDFLPLTLAFFIFALKGELETQSVIGFGLTYIIFTFGYSTSIPDLIGLQISASCEQKQYKTVIDTLFRILFCVLVYIGCSLILSFWSYSIMIGVGIDHQLAYRCSLFIKWMTVPKLIEITLFFLKSLLISQKITDVFTYINMATCSNLVISSYIFMYKMNISEMGYFCVFLLKNLIETGFLLYFLKNRCSREYLFIPSLKDITKGFGDSFFYSVKILVGNYGEWTASEVNSYFAALSRKAMNIVSWSCAVNLIILNFFFGCGEMAYLRTYGAIALGLKDFKSFILIRKKCLFYGLANHCILGILLIIFSNTVAKFYTSDPETHYLMTRVFQLLSVNIVMDWWMVFNSTCLRLIMLESFQFKTMAALYPTIIVIFAYLFFFVIKWHIYGLVVSLTLSNLVVCLVMHYKYHRNLQEFFDGLEKDMIVEQITPKEN